MRIAKRLEKVETYIETLAKHSLIIEAIDKYIHYDKLPNNEYKTLYCEYLGIERQIFENINIAVFGDLHTTLQIIKRPTDKEFRRIIAEIEQDILFNQ